MREPTKPFRPQLQPDSLIRGLKRKSKEERIRQLEEEIKASLESSKHPPINFSLPPHNMITEVLYFFAYQKDERENKPEKKPVELKVAYGDGSKGKPLKLRVLEPPVTGEGWDESRVFNVGTLSNRHLDYDRVVDMYLIRDRETRKLTQNNAEIDSLAYDRMRDILNDPWISNERVCMRLYQTGLEPLVVGMYRAIIDHLIERHTRKAPLLMIQPVFFIEERDDPAKANCWT